MNKVPFSIIAAALLANSIRILAQEPTTSTGPEGIAPPSSSRPADPPTGVWTGEWQLSGRRGISGSMEMEVDVKDDQVNGRVKSRCTPADPLEWEKLAGVRKGEKIYAQYDRGGRCGKVDVIYSIDLEGKVMTGTFSNEYPASGTFRLTR